MNGILTIKTDRPEIVPLRFRENDFVLASFPRSGNTWLRFILAHLMTGRREEITFHNYHRYIPDICFIQSEAEWRAYAPFPRIIKSHLLPQPEYRNAIYIVRDPRAALLSYWHYEDKPCAFREFIRKEDIWPSSWGRHVAAWLEHGKAHNVLFVKYEDLYKEPLSQLLRVLKHLGVDYDDHDIVQESLSRSRFDSMERIEKEKGFWRPLPGGKFVRSGKPDGWKEEMGEEDAREIASMHHDLMNYFAYV